MVLSMSLEKRTAPMVSRRLTVLIFAFIEVFRAGFAVADDGHHPLLGPYDGAKIYESNSKEFLEEYAVAISPVTHDGELSVKRISGKYSHIHYEVNTADGIDLVSESYLHSLQKQGFSLLFKCKQEQCGGDIVQKLFGGTPLQSGYNYVIGEVGGISPDDFVYMAASQKVESTEIVVALIFRQFVGVDAPIQLVQDVLEIDQLKLKEVDVSLDFESGIRATGKVVLDGLFFDHDGAELKKNSDSTLGQIAEYLKASKGDRFYVVGHTDSVGSYPYNLDLSKRRAISVVRILTDEHEIEKGRLVPIGVGPVSPVSSNKLESGRSLNRRVELVLEDDSSGSNP